MYMNMSAACARDCAQMILFLIFLGNYGIAMYLTVPPYVITNSEETNSDGHWQLTAMLQDLFKLGTHPPAPPTQAPQSCSSIMLLN